MNANANAKIPAITAEIIGTVLTVAVNGANGWQETIRVDARELSEEIQTQALMHGLKQKVVDAAAIPRDTVTGRSAGIDDKYNAMNEVAARLIAGAWNKARATGEGGAESGFLVQALVEMSGKPLNEVKEKVAAMTKEQCTALRANERVAVIIARIKASRSKVDTNGLLDDLMG